MDKLQQLNKFYNTPKTIKMKNKILILITLLFAFSCDDNPRPELNKPYYTICNNCQYLIGLCDTIFYTPLHYLGDDSVSVRIKSNCGKTIQYDVFDYNMFTYCLTPLKGTNDGEPNN